jgi:hypothetical protein
MTILFKKSRLFIPHIFRVLERTFYDKCREWGDKRVIQRTFLAQENKKVVKKGFSSNCVRLNFILKIRCN